jgi:chloramphenicol O-acetyltransferase type A
MSTFGFSLIQYDPNFDLFKENALTEIERIKSTTGILHEHLKMIT